MRETYGREVYYDIPDPKLKQATQWLIANPNRVNLGRIGLRYKGATLNKSTIVDPKQELDLWNGVITSVFKVDGKDVKVITQGDFESDAVAFDICSDLISSGELQIEMDFPYPPIHTTDYKYEVSNQRAASSYTIVFLTLLCRSLLVFTIFRRTTPQISCRTASIEPQDTYITACRS